MNVHVAAAFCLVRGGWPKKGFDPCPVTPPLVAALNPALRAACRATGQPMWKLAVLARFTHHARLSQLICAETVPATATNKEQLRRIATLVGFPIEQLFLFDENEAGS